MMKKFTALWENYHRTHEQNCKYLHIGSVQVWLRPLTRGSLDVAMFLCLRDIRQNHFQDSLLGE